MWNRPNAKWDWVMLSMDKGSGCLAHIFMALNCRLVKRGNKLLLRRWIARHIHLIRHGWQKIKRSIEFQVNLEIKYSKCSNLIAVGRIYKERSNTHYTYYTQNVVNSINRSYFTFFLFFSFYLIPALYVIVSMHSVYIFFISSINELICYRLSFIYPELPNTTRNFKVKYFIFILAIDERFFILGYVF